VKEKKQNDKKDTKKTFLLFFLDILANIKNFLYIFSTLISAILFYYAMDKDVWYCIVVLGFLFISYIPLIYQK
jgi:magnesium-transporting ATPase (P-type)